MRAVRLMRIDVTRQLARCGFVVNRDRCFRVQMLRTRVDIERADKRDAIVEHRRLRVQRIGSFVFPKINPETEKFFLRRFVAKLHQHRIIRGNRVGDHFNFGYALLLHLLDFSE